MFDYSGYKYIKTYFLMNNSENDQQTHEKEELDFEVVI